MTLVTIISCNSRLLYSWGDWRCNVLAFAGLVSTGRYVASLEPEERQTVLGGAFFPALVAQGIGTVSGELCRRMK